MAKLSLTQQRAESLARDWAVLLELCARDYHTQYRATWLGTIWAYLQPFLLVGAIYLVFSFGLRAGTVVGMPFAIYLLSGIACWLYLAGNMNAIISVVQNHAFLVKKTQLRLELLPLVKLATSLPQHAFVVACAIGLAWWNGFAPGWHTLQLIYYYLAMALWLLGVGWVTSASVLFVRDVEQVVGVLTQLGFWLTPVFWSLALVPDRYHWLLQANPAHYLVTGYRAAIVTGEGFWERPGQTLWFWAITLALLLFGHAVFQRLRPHFDDVL